MISVSKLTKNLQFFVSLYFYCCLLQDLMMKQIIGNRYISDGVYILDEWAPPSVACSSIISSFEAHCRLGYISLPVLRKLCPQFHNVPLIDCESCHFAKHHRSSLSPRNNKQADFTFELVHYDIWGPCMVVSKVGFTYFITFVDNFSRMTWVQCMKNRAKVLPFL